MRQEITYDPTAPYWLVYRYAEGKTPHLFTTHSLEKYADVLLKVPAEIMLKSHNACSCVTPGFEIHVGCTGVEHIEKDGFSRGMCEECSAIRCDLPEDHDAIYSSNEGQETGK